MREQGQGFNPDIDKPDADKEPGITRRFFNWAGLGAAASVGTRKAFGQRRPDVGNAAGTLGDIIREKGRTETYNRRMEAWEMVSAVEEIARAVRSHMDSVNNRGRLVLDGLNRGSGGGGLDRASVQRVNSALPNYEKQINILLVSLFDLNECLLANRPLSNDEKKTPSKSKAGTAVLLGGVIAGSAIPNRETQDAAREAEQILRDREYQKRDRNMTDSQARRMVFSTVNDVLSEIHRCSENVDEVVTETKVASTKTIHRIDALDKLEEAQKAMKEVQLAIQENQKEILGQVAKDVPRRRN